MKTVILNGIIHFSYFPSYKVAAGVSRASNGTLQECFEHQVRKNVKASDHGEFISILPESISGSFAALSLRPQLELGVC